MQNILCSPISDVETNASLGTTHKPSANRNTRTQMQTRQTYITDRQTNRKEKGSSTVKQDTKHTSPCSIQSRAAFYTIPLLDASNFPHLSGLRRRNGRNNCFSAHGERLALLLYNSSSQFTCTKYNLPRFSTTAATLVTSRAGSWRTLKRAACVTTAPTVPHDCLTTPCWSATKSFSEFLLRSGVGSCTVLLQPASIGHHQKTPEILPHTILKKKDHVYTARRPRSFLLQQPITTKLQPLQENSNPRLVRSARAALMSCMTVYRQ